MKFNNIGIIRIFTGLLFLIPGLMKLTNPSGIIGMLGNLGIPLPVLMGWALIFVEVLGGLALIVGWKTKISAVLLAIVLVVATLTVIIPMFNEPLGIPLLMFHLLGIATLVALIIGDSGEPNLE